MIEKTKEEWHGDADCEGEEEPEIGVGESERTGRESEAEGSAEAAQWLEDAGIEVEEQREEEGQDTDRESVEYRSWFWYWGKVCLSVYQRFPKDWLDLRTWYFSLGVHVGSDVELHLLWWIVMLMPAWRGRELEEADRYYQEGIEPE